MNAAERLEAARQEREHRIREVAWLLQFEGDADQIARRSGFNTTRGAIRALRTWGRPDLSRALAILAGEGDPYNDHSGLARLALPGLIPKAVPA